jgi:hypothetical protein
LLEIIALDRILAVSKAFSIRAGASVNMKSVQKVAMNPEENFGEPLTHYSGLS